MIRCGDCGTETQVIGWYRTCVYCGTRTKIIRRRKKRPATVPLPKRAVNREEPDQVALCEQHHLELGQCPHCLHPECKCAY